ncbi:MAG: ribonuclease E activity regulator RraA [Myxococcota bacterium]
MTDPFFTADLCDAFSEEVQVATPLFRSFGGRDRACGPIQTVRAYGDNSLVREALSESGDGAVLVVDGGGALQWAMFGDALATLAHDNGWSAVIVHGCIRDAEQIRGIDLGVWALATHPMKTVKRGQGLRQVPVRFADVAFQPGHFAYADRDGILVAARKLPNAFAPVLHP